MKIKNSIILLLFLLFPLFIKASSLEFNLDCGKQVVRPGELVKCSISASSDVKLFEVFGNYEINGLNYINFNNNNFFNINSSTISGFNLKNDTLSIDGNFIVGTLELKVPLDAEEERKYDVIINNLQGKDINSNILYSSDIKKTLRVISTNNNLKTLKIDGYSFDNDFDQNLTKYNVYDVKDEKIVISGVAENLNSSVTGLGEKKLNVGENKFIINVTSEAGTVKEYTIVVNKIDTRDDTNTLNKLEVNGFSLTPVFKPYTNTYSINVLSNTNSVDVCAELTSEKSKFVENYGPRTIHLDFGITEVEIKVESEKNIINTYKLIINKIDERSNNNYLETLTIKDCNINFNKYTYYYESVVNNNVDKIEIDASPAHEDAIIEGLGLYNINVGENRIIIKVIAENGTERNYTFIINRLEKVKELKSQDFISYLNIKNANIDFKHDIYEYTIQMDKIEPLEFDYALKDEIEVEIIGNKNIFNGSKVLFTMYASNGQTLKYIFNVYENTKEIPVEQTNNSVNIYMICILLIIVAIITTLCILLFKKDKQN